MTNYGLIYSTTRPPQIEITESMVFIATDIESYNKEVEDKIESGYKYNYTAYSKDEYIARIALENTQLKEQILETQEAVVELYEMLEG